MDTLHQYLKDSTRAKHSEAEGHPFQGALAQGKLAFPGYKDYLIQLRALHQCVEQKIRDHLTDPGLSAVVKDDYYQLSFIDNDLRALGVDTQSKPVLPYVRDFCALPLWSERPISLLGPLYVLLGSKHGAKFIAHNVKQAYELESGYSYFNPYGENFRELWQQFTTGLNGLKLSESDREAVLQGANETFDVFGRIGVSIWDSLGKDAVRA